MENMKIAKNINIEERLADENHPIWEMALQTKKKKKNRRRLRTKRKRRDFVPGRITGRR